MQRSTKIILIP